MGDIPIDFTKTWCPNNWYGKSGLKPKVSSVESGAFGWNTLLLLFGTLINNYVKRCDVVRLSLHCDS